MIYVCFVVQEISDDEALISKITTKEELEDSPKTEYQVRSYGTVKLFIMSGGRIRISENGH